MGNNQIGHFTLKTTSNFYSLSWGLRKPPPKGSVLVFLITWAWWRPFFHPTCIWWGLSLGLWKLELGENSFILGDGPHFALVPLCHISDHNDCLCQRLYFSNKLLSAARKFLLKHAAGFMHLMGGFSTPTDKLYVKILLNNWCKCK